ncbi:MAG: hypothetical protein AB7T19_02035 [Planctomycetota bacterium]
MAFEFLTWLAYHGVAAILAVWAIGSALSRGQAGGVGHRAWTLAAAALLGPTMVIAMLATPLGRPDFHLAYAVLPVLAIAAAWSNTLTLARAPAGLRLVALPIALWNAALAAVFGSQALIQIAGFDGGNWANGLLAGYAAFTEEVASPTFVFAPFALHMPLCLPLAGHFRGLVRTTVIVAAAIALAGFVGLAREMPEAWHRMQQFRSESTDLAPLRTDQVLGIHVELPSKDVGEARRTERRGQWLGLGAGSIAIRVTAAQIADPIETERIRDEISFARSQKRSVFVIPQPTARATGRPAPNLLEFVEEMAKLHWLCAERLTPDWLVLYFGPFGRLTDLRSEIGTVDEWAQILERGAEDVRRASPATQPFVVFESRALHAQRLMQHVAGSRSALAAIGIAIDGDLLDLDGLVVALDRLAVALEVGAQEKPVVLLGVGASLARVGGERGQWHMLARVLDFASRQPRVQSVVIDELADGPRSRGLIALDGRLRLAYRELRAMRLLPDARPPR